MASDKSDDKASTKTAIYCKSDGHPYTFIGAYVDPADVAGIIERHVKEHPVGVQHHYIYKQDPPVSHGCLAPDTLIWMADGSTRKIAEVGQGDRILACDADRNVLADDVAHARKSDHDQVLTLRTGKDRTIEMSISQPIMTVAGPVMSGQLFLPANFYQLAGSRDQLSLVEAVQMTTETAETPRELISIHTQSNGYFFVGEDAIAVKCKGGGPYGPPPDYRPL